MALGQYLVRELGFEDGVDTLGRWMAHHLAELLGKAENATIPEERLKAQQAATETILKIWEHRRSLPGKVYPLAAYNDVLLILARLRPGDNPFRYFGHHEGREQLAADLFDSLTRLIIVVLLMKVPSDTRAAEVEAAATEALSETEQHILRSLQQWDALFKPTDADTDRAQKTKKSSKHREINLDEIAVELIDNITTILAKLRSELEERGAPHDSAMR